MMSLAFRIENELVLQAGCTEIESETEWIRIYRIKELAE
jgi:hypothetical protein